MWIVLQRRTLAELLRTRRAVASYWPVWQFYVATSLIAGLATFNNIEVE